MRALGLGWELSVSECCDTLASIKAAQNERGFISWVPGGHGDPWNHLEAAMALSAYGEHDAAGRALSWLAENQRADGAWCASYHADGSVREHHLDTNVSSYVAAGLLWQTLETRDLELARRYWPMVRDALSFVLSHQLPRGEFAWSVDGSGEINRGALLAASSAIHLSLCAGAVLAELLGEDRSGLDRASAALKRAIAGREACFIDNHEYAMDWYYPVLCGALDREEARERLLAGQAEFFHPEGVRCRSDRSWVTTAESAECAIAYARVGLIDEARWLLFTTRGKRAADGSYATGIVYPELVQFPTGEQTTYSAAAVLLAHKVLRNEGAARLLFEPASSEL